VEFNIEGNPFAPAQGNAENGYPGLLKLVELTKPHQCTLVPDSDQQLTSDHGFDLTQSADQLAPVIQRLKDLGVRVSLFMDPDIMQIKLAKDIGADRIELYTGPYAEAFEQQHNSSSQFTALFETYRSASVYASGIGLGVNAGHDLSLLNLPQFATIAGLLEVSIGHALVIDALRMGMASTVQAYLAICRQSA